jgi:uncharacterized protein (DUF2141 family)
MKIMMAVLMLWAAHASAQEGTVVLTVSGVDVRKGGDLAVAIFTRENFLKVGKQLMGLEATVTSASMELIITDVPPGDYGIAVFQDADRNKQLKTNFFGLPQELTGFSNDARIRFGPPSFEDARITVIKEKTTLTKMILR